MALAFLLCNGNQGRWIGGFTYASIPYMAIDKRLEYPATAVSFSNRTIVPMASLRGLSYHLQPEFSKFVSLFSPMYASNAKSLVIIPWLSVTRSLYLLKDYIDFHLLRY